MSGLVGGVSAALSDSDEVSVMEDRSERAAWEEVCDARDSRDGCVSIREHTTRRLVQRRLTESGENGGEYNGD